MYKYVIFLIIPFLPSHLKSDIPIGALLNNMMSWWFEKIGSQREWPCWSRYDLVGSGLWGLFCSSLSQCDTQSTSCCFLINIMPGPHLPACYHVLCQDNNGLNLWNCEYQLNVFLKRVTVCLFTSIETLTKIEDFPFAISFAKDSARAFKRRVRGGRKQNSIQKSSDHNEALLILGKILHIIHIRLKTFQIL